MFFYTMLVFYDNKNIVICIIIVYYYCVSYRRMIRVIFEKCWYIRYNECDYFLGDYYRDELLSDEFNNFKLLDIVLKYGYLN